MIEYTEISNARNGNKWRQPPKISMWHTLLEQYPLDSESAKMSGQFTGINEIYNNANEKWIRLPEQDQEYPTSDTSVISVF